MTTLFDFALPEARSAPNAPVAVLPARRRRGSLRRPPEERARHEAGDHSLCDPARAGHGVCSQCGKTIQVARSSAPPERRRCRECQRARPSGLDPQVCELCECTYVPKFRSRPGTRQRWCSKSCTRAWANGARPPYERQAVTGMARKVALSRARRLRHAQTWDGITDEEILERDGWRCQIPGCTRRPIRKDAKYPHPRSKSIDHIVPLSLGGDDIAANKRAAHLGCNVARGNRMAVEQLPLFGSIRDAPLATVTAGERAVMFQRRKRSCGCGAIPLEGRKFCQDCLDRRAAEAEARRAERAGPTSPVHYYVCRYCGDLKTCKRTGQLREVCPARTCQLARLAANNLRVRHGLSAEEADAQVAEQVAAATGPGYGRWQHGAAQRSA